MKRLQRKMELRIKFLKARLLSKKCHHDRSDVDGKHLNVW